MPMNGIVQPDVIAIDEGLRLRKFDGVYDFALGWYQDPEVVYLVDGVKNSYTMERLSKMYRYLDGVGELYFIEIWQDGGFRPIGDVTFWQEDLPIVIGEPACRGRGIGGKVIGALVRRAQELGFDHVSVGEIYDWNKASRRCFLRAGFRPCGKTEHGSRYTLVFPQGRSLR